MELTLLAVIVALAVAVLLLAVSTRRGQSSTPGNEPAGLVPSTPSSVEPSALEGLEIVRRDDHSELVLGDQALMSLERWTPSADVQLEVISSTFAAWIGTMLDNPRVLEYIAGERWVLAKVPQAIRDGGKWMSSGGVQKAVALQPNSHLWAAIPQLVRGGAAVGGAAVLGPAIIGGVAIAYAHQQITDGIQRVEARINDLDRRMQASDLGIIDGSRRLLREMEEWGPPHSWPEQLRWELAVRRAALDPVCFVQRARVDQLLAAMLKDGTKFVGLGAGERAELEHSLEVLSLATMTRAQIGFATTMVLLDSADAPFGLERLSRLTEDFVSEMNLLVEDLQAVLDGERPGRIVSLTKRLTLIHRRKVAPTERVVAKLLDDLVEVAAAVDEGADSTLVFSVQDGELQVASPQFALGTGTGADDAARLAGELDRAARIQALAEPESG